jgi:hypothetical protein
VYHTDRILSDAARAGAGHDGRRWESLRQAVLEEWEALPQEWINKLILKQEHWVTVLMQRYGWSTSN